MADPLNRLNTALADRYTIVRELGSGGMATVYLAHDLKHDRHVAIKVLRPELAAAIGAERFLREIEVTARLTHPHILPLLDSGTIEEPTALPLYRPTVLLYYTMPYIEGETLRERMNREGQLPLDDALQITREVAAALTYAHSHDVIHRDIKPENILLSAGEAVVADFGIARAITEAGGKHLTETGISIGTPAYMSPEQASGESRLDGRSDLYSLGCVLYEMLAGEPPHTGPTAQAIVAKKLSDTTPRVSVLRETVPQPIDQAIAKALAKATADRFVTADQFIAALTAPAEALSPRPKARSRRLLGYVAGIALLVAVVVAGYGTGRYMRVGGPGTLLGQAVIAEHDRILVAEFENRTDDSLLATVVTGAVEVVLEQSRVVRVLSPEARSAGMARMGLESGDVLSDSLVRQLALRENAKAYVTGEVSRLGSGYQLTARVAGSVDGQVVLTEMAAALDGAHLIQAVDDLGQKLRRGIGESIRQVRTTPSLEQVTTGSVEALRAYSEAIRAESQGDFARALRLLDEAIAVDSAFAMAHRKLAVILSNMAQQPARRANALTQAYLHRNRLTAVERYRVVGMYHIQVTEDWESALAAYETLLELVPDDISVLNNLAFLNHLLRDNARGVEFALRALELDSSRVASYWNVSEGLFLTGRYAEAEATAQRYAERFPDAPHVLQLRAWLDASRGEYDSADVALHRLVDSHRGNVMWVARANEGLAQLSVLRGRLREAAARWRDALLATDQRHLPGEYLAIASRQALADALVRGEAADAVRLMEDALERHPLQSVEPLDRPYGDLVALYSLANELPRARALLAEYRESGAEERNRLSRAEYRWASGTVALAEDRAQEAIEEFRLSDDGPCILCRMPWLARAFDAAGNSDSAIALYERYLSTPWPERLALDFDELAGAYLRLGELHHERGDRAKAIDYYNRFVELWNEADAELQPLVESTRGALARLTGEPR